MAKTLTIVDRIESIAAPSTANASVKSAEAPAATIINFPGGQTAKLDPADPRFKAWAGVLFSLNQSGRPAYVEANARTGQITELLQPKLLSVDTIKPLNGGPDLRVELIISHAIHFLRKNHPQFSAYERLLQDARRNKTRVWVTETLDTHEIIDLRPAPDDEPGIPFRTPPKIDVSSKGQKIAPGDVRDKPLSR